MIEDAYRPPAQSVSEPRTRYEALIEWARTPTGWRGLLRGIGIAFIAFVIISTAMRLFVGGDQAWSRGAILRLGILFVSGLGLATGRGGRWLGVIGLAIYVIAMGRYFLSHPDIALAAGQTARLLLIVVLLHPGARSAMDPQASDSGTPPSAWVRSTTWSSLMLVTGAPIYRVLQLMLGW